jgi:hypothetical protein
MRPDFFRNLIEEGWHELCAKAEAQHGDDHKAVPLSVEFDGRASPALLGHCDRLDVLRIVKGLSRPLLN